MRKSYIIGRTLSVALIAGVLELGTALADDDPEGPEGHGLAAIVGRKRFEQYRLRERL